MSGGMCFIQSKSGSGKTFLVARVLAQLIHNHNKEKANDAPVILFSQLKLALERTLHQTDLTTATLSCMHLQGGEYSRVEDMIRSLGEGVFPDVDSGGPSAILFVDSLDEFDKSHLASLPHLDAGLRQSGILPIWSIRQLEFNKLGQDIVGESPRNLIAQDGDDAVGVSITLRLKQQWVGNILAQFWKNGTRQVRPVQKRDRWLRRSLWNTSAPHTVNQRCGSQKQVEKAVFEHHRTLA